MTVELRPELAAWQKSKHGLGMLDFGPSDELSSRWHYAIAPHFKPLATHEADLLCLDTRSGELFVLDHEVAGRVLCHAAKDQASFVAAATAVEAHFERCGEDDDYCNDESIGIATRERCAELAGGSAYDSFFCGLLGW